MKIAKIQFTHYPNYIQNKKQENQNKESFIQNSMTVPFAYQDFNINFRGRTPEDFYAQEFNVKFMPERMKEYLNEDYETRKHIPPQQIMSESFKYLDAADTIEDVKSIYPEFSYLHEASKGIRTGIVADINVAKELSDAPLLKDGEDHLGVYILKKIYLEGKTIKEINKDFYEKDMNPEYKGVITQPIDYATTRAYGIQYPKLDFWKSFIATREEYKQFFVTLPKHSKEDLKKELKGEKLSDRIKRNLDKALGNSKPVENALETKKTAPRKYKLKDHQKNQIKQDVINANGDIETIKKAITKRFSKDDPLASFLDKYRSPIMTIAADKVHLSEEQKSFSESLREEGKPTNNFLAKFMKGNKELLGHYGTAIIDSIELFTEIYDCGGLHGINTNYEKITEETENKKAIDFVNDEFLELLEYVQNIGPNREKKYAAHDVAQKEWEEHFLWKYGELKPEVPVEEKTPVEPKVIKSPEEILREEAIKNGAKVYELNGVNGEDLRITVNVDEGLAHHISKSFIGFPSNFIKLLFTKALESPFMTENMKLTYAVSDIADKINDDRIYGDVEKHVVMNSIFEDIGIERTAASFASAEAYAKYSDFPEKVYRVLMDKRPEEDVEEYNRVILKNIDKPEVKKELNRLYEYYKKPATPSEANKIAIMIMDFIRNFDFTFSCTPDSIFYYSQDHARGITNLQNEVKASKAFKEVFKKKITLYVQNKVLAISKGLLSKSESPKVQKAKLETISNIVVRAMAETGGKL